MSLKTYEVTNTLLSSLRHTWGSRGGGCRHFHRKPRSYTCSATVAEDGGRLQATRALPVGFSREGDPFNRALLRCAIAAGYGRFDELLPCQLQHRDIFLDALLSSLDPLHQLPHGGVFYMWFVS